jgi:hypothetical protein
MKPEVEIQYVKQVTDQITSGGRKHLLDLHHLLPSHVLKPLPQLIYSTETLELSRV